MLRTHFFFVSVTSLSGMPSARAARPTHGQIVVAMVLIAFSLAVLTFLLQGHVWGYSASEVRYVAHSGQCHTGGSGKASSEG